MIKFTHKIPSCSIEDDQRGVSVKGETTTHEALPHAPQQPWWKPRPPKSSALGLQGPVLVNDCFLLYPFQLETNRRGSVPLSKPVGAPVPVSLQLPYITSSQQDMPSCFATTPMGTPSLSLMQEVLADLLQCKQ